MVCNIITVYFYCSIYFIRIDAGRKGICFT